MITSIICSSNICTVVAKGDQSFTDLAGYGDGHEIDCCTSAGDETNNNTISFRIELDVFDREIGSRRVE
jgi:hypothetical protein